MGDCPFDFQPLRASTAGAGAALAARQARIQQHIAAQAAAGDQKPLTDQLHPALHDVDCEAAACYQYDLSHGVQAQLPRTTAQTLSGAAQPPRE